VENSIYDVENSIYDVENSIYDVENSIYNLCNHWYHWLFQAPKVFKVFKSILKSIYL